MQDVESQERRATKHAAVADQRWVAALNVAVHSAGYCLIAGRNKILGAKPEVGGNQPQTYVFFGETR